MINDLRFAFKMLAKTPAFTFVAVATLALGIGANSAIFSVIRTVLLQPLPYHDSARLIDVFSLDPAGAKDALSMTEVDDLRAQMQSLGDLAGFQSQSVNVTGGE